MSFFQYSIDSLFEDLPSPLYLLPAEIRNAIYEEVILKGEEAHSIKISETGHIILPSLMVVSKQIYLETVGYIAQILSKADTMFTATIRDYNIKPLLNTLNRIATKTGIARSELVARTKISFVGEVNLGNLLAWIHGNIEDANAFPMFSFEEANIFNHIGGDVFNGAISLRAVLMLHEQYSERSRLSTWNAFARRFLANLEAYDLQMVSRLPHEASDSEIKVAVLKTFAIWHDIFLQKRNIQKRVIGKKNKRAIDDEHFDVAEAMRGFTMHLVHWIISVES